MVYKETGVSSTRPRQENTNGSRCIRLCDRRSIVNRVQGWIMETGSIPLKVLK